MPVPSTSQPRVQRRLLRDEARDAIREAILDGTFQPGEALDTDALQEWLGISRSPIRGALAALQLEGVVEIQAQSGTRVATPAPEDVENSLQAMGAIMGGVMRITVPVLDKVAMKKLVDLVERCREAVVARDNSRHLESALKVYDVLLRHCPNPVLVNIARMSLTPLTFGYRASIGVRIPNWDLLVAGWGRVKHGLTSGDNVLAELAFEEMHRLPLPDVQWDPALWRERVMRTPID